MKARKHPILTAILLFLSATGSFGAETSSSVVVETLKIPLDRSTPNSGLDGSLSKKLPSNVLSTRVILIIEKGNAQSEKELSRLYRPGGEFETMKSIGWKIGPEPSNHIQIVNREDVPDLVRRLSARTYPAVACISDREIVRSFTDGCTTPLDAWTFGWLIKGISERPAGPITEKARVETTGNYRLRGNHWTLEGDPNPAKQTIVAHLRGPNHGHASGAYGAIENWSYQELLSLHDDLHEREGGTIGGNVMAQGNYQAPAANRNLDAFSGNRKVLGK